MVSVEATAKACDYTVAAHAYCIATPVDFSLTNVGSISDLIFADGFA